MARASRFGTVVSVQIIDFARASGQREIVVIAQQGIRRGVLRWSIGDGVDWVSIARPLTRQGQERALWRLGQHRERGEWWLRGRYICGGDSRVLAAALAAWEQIGDSDTSRSMNWMGMRARQLPRKECDEQLDAAIRSTEAIAAEAEIAAIKALLLSLSGWVLAFVPDTPLAPCERPLEGALADAGWIGDGGVLWACGPEGEATGEGGCVLRVGMGGLVAVAKRYEGDEEALGWASGLSEDISGVSKNDIERLEALWQTARIFTSNGAR